MRNAVRVVAVFAVLVASLFGCAPDPESIEISPPDSTVNKADDAPKMAARVLDAEGKQIPDAKVAWSSTAPDVVAIDPATGVTTVKGSGKAEINAQVGTVTGLAMITVELYTRLQARPTLQLNVNQVEQLLATIVDETETPIQGEITWATADPKVATVVGSRGEVKGIAAGTTTITATAKFLKAEVKVEVVNPTPPDLKASKDAITVAAGKTGKVEVQALDAEGKPVEGFQIFYDSTTPEVATVGEDGTVSGLKKGETVVVATAGEKTVKVVVTVK
jgi:uncharacterized protein YjdB